MPAQRKFLWNLVQWVQKTPQITWAFAFGCLPETEGKFLYLKTLPSSDIGVSGFSHYIPLPATSLHTPGRCHARHPRRKAINSPHPSVVPTNHSNTKHGKRCLKRTIVTHGLAGTKTVWLDLLTAQQEAKHTSYCKPIQVAMVLEENYCYHFTKPVSFLTAFYILSRALTSHQRMVFLQPKRPLQKVTAGQNAENN